MKWICLLLVGLFNVVPAIAEAEDGVYRKVLTSANDNKQLKTEKIWKKDVKLDTDIEWSVSKLTLQGGKQQGVDLITIDNGVLLIRLVPTRGMSIYEVIHKKTGLRLGWESPVKELVHPSLIDLESKGGLGWLEGFNEWMVRCGLEYAGHPGLDQFKDNTGSDAEMTLTLHGKIGNIPASEVEVLVEKEAPFRITVRGIVYERAFYGPKLKLVTEVSTTLGSDTLTISDTVTNQGGLPQEMQMIYHTNYGTPLLEAGAKVVTAAKSITPMNDHLAKQWAAAEEKFAFYETYKAPTTGFVEEVFLVAPKADDNDQSIVLLHNANGDKGASITWSVQQLPYLTIWKNTAATGDGYVTGLEPGTGYPFNRKVERAAGRVPKLKPGETRKFDVTFGIHIGSESVNEVKTRIETLQGEAPELITTPPKTE